MEIKKFFVRNQHGVSVCKCCASCAHKRLDKNFRICMKGEGQVPSYYYCPNWEMNEVFSIAGKGDGMVKKDDYLRFALDIITREEIEALRASANKLIFTRTTIPEIRNMYKKKYGTIYAIEK